MFRSRSKPDYDHIAQLEQAIREMDEAAAEPVPPRRRELFTPPILQPRVEYRPVVPAASMSASGPPWPRVASAR